MQNKANLRKAKMSASVFATKDYERNDIFAVPENKAKTKPIKANLPEGEIDAKCLFTKEYEEKCG